MNKNEELERLNAVLSEVKLDVYDTSYRRERTRRILNVTSISLGVMGVALIALKQEILVGVFGQPLGYFLETGGGYDGRMLNLVGLASLLTCSLLLMYRYLLGIPFFDFQKLALDISHQRYKNKEGIQKNSEDNGAERTSNLSVPDDVSAFDANITQGTTQDAEQLDHAIRRLKSEISTLNRRGNINLLIGVGTTITAVGILASTILYDKPIMGNGLEAAIHFAPRVTLSLFIEIFSFFFLRLYSSGLQDIKYYQNEITNIESKCSALKNAIRIGDKASTTKILLSLATTERNFILKKGETTQGIEASKVQTQADKELLSIVSELSKRK